MEKQAANAGKRAAGYKAADLVKKGMVIGLGTGSTVFFAMERLQERISAGLEISGVPTSYQTAIRARVYGIPLTTLDEHPVLDLAIDGADQVDPQFRLIKGRGAAQTREKCVAAAARRFIVVVDASKLTPCLNAPVPVEVLPFALTPVMAKLKSMGGVPVVREAIKKDGPVITDNGNFEIDCAFGAIGDPEALEAALVGIPGVIGSGLFTGFYKKTKVIAGDEKRCRVLKKIS
ncbi:MAG: ribose-5-phosphate isomerase RpiA [Methanoregula sp.]|nr:MAG: ribose-5-phosphate isomerase RpiA [Methanoregula sp.]